MSQKLLEETFLTGETPEYAGLAVARLAAGVVPLLTFIPYFFFYLRIIVKLILLVVYFDTTLFIFTQVYPQMFLLLVFLLTSSL